MRNVHIVGPGMAANALDEIPEHAEIWTYSPANEPALLPEDRIDRFAEDLDGVMEMLREAVELVGCRLGADVGSTHDRIIGAMPVAIVLPYPAVEVNQEALRLLQQITRTGQAVNVGVILLGTESSTFEQVDTDVIAG